MKLTPSRRRRPRAVAVVVAASLATLVMLTAAPAAIAKSAGDSVDRFVKRELMRQYTQTSRTSYDLWNQDRVARSPWSRTTFDWSTDFCSNSPDQPLGFDFRMPCYRHDWGYRNYHDEGIFPANKPRIDDAFHADMRRVCDSVHVLARPACASLAWTYYQAVVAFGEIVVSDEDLGQAEALMSRTDR